MMQERQGNAVRRNGVLIVGAGPTGLTLALACSAYGVPFTIIDQNEAPRQHSKGIALNLASQIKLDALGLPAFGRDARRVETVNITWAGRRFTRLSLRGLACSPRSLAVQMQSASERALLEALARAGHQVMWGRCLLSVAQDHAQALATVADATGQARRWSFDHVIGCEGKRSIVREAIGGQMVGQDYGMDIVLGDLHLDDALPSTQASYHVHEDGFAILVPMGEGLWRAVVSRPPGGDDSTAGRQAYLSHALARFTGRPWRFAPPLWLSSLPLYMRSSTRLNSGRLSIAGDAVHLFCPIGGAGMNTGIGDAVDLAWRLALTHHLGVSHASLLGSYERNRGAQIAAAIGQTDALTRLICRLIDAHPIRDLMAPRLRNRRAWRVALPAQLAGLSAAAVSADGPVQGDVFWPAPLLRRHLLSLPQTRRAAARGALLLVMTVDRYVGDAGMPGGWRTWSTEPEVASGCVILLYLSGPDVTGQHMGGGLLSGRQENVAWMDDTGHSGLADLPRASAWLITPDGQVLMRTTMACIDQVQTCLREMMPGLARLPAAQRSHRARDQEGMST